MGWAELISDNFSAIMALAGVLVGAVGTYLVQSRLHERQRTWALDDQRRQWRREQLERVREAQSQVTICLDKLVGIVKATKSMVDSDQLPMYTLEDIREGLKSVSEAVSGLLGIDWRGVARYDTELGVLLAAWHNVYQSAVPELGEDTEPIQEVAALALRISERINCLIEATFD